MEGILILILVIILYMILRSIITDKNDKAYFSAQSSNKFNPDYFTKDRGISIESSSKRIMLKRGKKYRVYNPDEISGWRSGFDSVTFNNKVMYKYYIEFRVKDLDDPNPRVWFGGNNQERDKWYARVTTLFNG